MYARALGTSRGTARVYAYNACVTASLGSHSEPLRRTIDFLDIRRFRFARCSRRGRRAEYRSDVYIVGDVVIVGRYALCCRVERDFLRDCAPIAISTLKFRRNTINDSKSFHGLDTWDIQADVHSWILHLKSC